MMRSRVLAVLLVVQVTAAATSYPNCSDPTTYTNYNKSTEYKGLNDDTPWDRTRQTSDKCDFTSAIPLEQPDTCGDCDFKLDGKNWYRFSQGPYVKIAEFLDATSASCPKKGNCNGFYQMALISNDSSVQRDGDVKHYNLTFSDPQGDCMVTDQVGLMIESLSCGEFILYKFPDAWSSTSSICTDTQSGQTQLPTPYSICMYDTVVDLTLTGKRKFYTKDESVPLICTSDGSPTPPRMTWTDQKDQDITSQTKRDPNQISLFSVVYSVDSTISYTSVTCLVADMSHTFYQVSLEATDVAGTENQELVATCRVHLDNFSAETQENLYLIEVLEGGEVYYTSQNISGRGDMTIDKEGGGTYRISLKLSDTTVPANLRSMTESWRCGVRDPITEVYTTVPFTITLNRKCGPGTGFIGEATECTTCPQNTSSVNNGCQDCPEEEISDPGSSQCRKEPGSYEKVIYSVVAGVSVAALIIAVIMFGTVIYFRRRDSRGKNNVVFSNNNVKI